MLASGALRRANWSGLLFTVESVHLSYMKTDWSSNSQPSSVTQPKKFCRVAHPATFVTASSKGRATRLSVRTAAKPPSACDVSTIGMTADSEICHSCRMTQLQSPSVDVSRAPQGRKCRRPRLPRAARLSSKKEPREKAFGQITVALTSVIKERGTSQEITKQSDKKQRHYRQTLHRVLVVHFNTIISTTALFRSRTPPH